MARLDLAIRNTSPRQPHLLRPPSLLNGEAKMEKPPITLLYTQEHLNANVISSHA